jgi:transcriptional regulator with XRE-family HTH domain
MTTRNNKKSGLEQDNLLGRRLRERRLELGMTLADLTSAAGISKGHASSIEKGTGLPSLPVLARIANALDMTLADALRVSVSPEIAAGHIDGAATAQLSLATSRIWVKSATFEGDAPAQSPVPTTGDDDIFVFVYEGSVTIEVDKDQIYELSTGDSIHCQSPKTLVCWTSEGATARTLWVSRRVNSQPEST